MVIFFPVITNAHGEYRYARISRLSIDNSADLERNKVVIPQIYHIQQVNPQNSA
jgi:hypothetical protein